MKRLILILMAILALGLVVVGCDDDDDDDDDAGTDTDSDTDTDTDTGTDNDTICQPPEPVILVEWVGVKEDGKSILETIQLSITNPKNITLEVTGTLHLNGLMNLGAQHVFEKVILEPGGSAQLTIDADELPLQSSFGIIQMYAEFTIATAGDRKPVHQATPGFYFRNSRGGKIALFREDVFYKEFSGILVPEKSDLNIRNPLGKIREDDGSFREVRWEDEEFSIKLNGVVIMELGGMDIEIGTEPE